MIKFLPGTGRWQPAGLTEGAPLQSQVSAWGVPFHHVPVTPDHLAEAHYIGVLFIVLTVA